MTLSASAHKSTGRRLDFIACLDALLYSSLVFGSEWAIGLALAGLVGAGLASARINNLRSCSTMLGVVLAVVHDLALPPLEIASNAAQLFAAITGVSASILLRPSAFPALLALWGRSVGPTCMVLAAPLLGIASLWTCIQLLAFNRASAESAGIVLALHLVAIELVNWFAWRRIPKVPVSGRVWFLAGATVATAAAIAFTPTVATFRPIQIGILWPRDDGPPEVIAEYADATGSFGWARAGQYGHLPAVLSKAGFSVAKIERLCGSSADLLMILSFFRSIASDEIACVRDHLRRGGHVIAVGEHSNLNQVMDRSKPLLAPLGLQLNFDTTNGLFGDRTGSFHWSRSSFGRGASTLTIVHNRGASVALSGRARPLLEGRFWHSDQGDHQAPERAFLSTYRVSSGDVIGPVVLAAESAEGSGRFVLWGDSSPFLNQHLLYTSKFIRYLLVELTGGHRVSYGTWLCVFGGVIFSVVAWFARSETLAQRSSIAALVLGVAGLLPSEPADRGRPTGAVVSTAEHNDYSRDPFDGRSLTGLGLNILRAGLTAELGDWAELHHQPSAIFIVNPRAPVNGSRRERLMSLVEGGATAVVTGGGQNQEFTDLVASFGFVIDSQTPLGALKGDTLNSWTAWRVTPPRGASPIVIDGQTVGGSLPFGLGQIVVLADSGAFISRNLEGEFEYDQRNIDFIQGILKKPE